LVEFFDSEIGRALVTTVILPVITIVGGMLVVFLKKKASEITKRIENETVQNYVNQANEAVLQAVDYMFQTYVDSLKKKGEFGPEAQKHAFEEAKKIALSLLTQEAKDLLQQLYNDVNLWLDTKIEQAVKQNKLLLSKNQTAGAS